MGAEDVVIGSGAGDLTLGAVGSASNLVFEESSYISGQGENTITLGIAGDTFVVATGTTPDDIVGVLGWNDTPVKRGMGSAIFLHVARSDYGPTEGCVALALPDLRRVLALGLTEISVT